MASPCYGNCESISFIFWYFGAIPWSPEKFQITVPTPWDRGSVIGSLWNVCVLFLFFAITRLFYENTVSPTDTPDNIGLRLHNDISGL